MENKTNYISPDIEVLNVKINDVLCTSIPGFGDGGNLDYDE